MNLYGLFILDVNIKYIVFSILYRHINVPMACKELKCAITPIMGVITLLSRGYCLNSTCDYITQRLCME